MDAERERSRSDALGTLREFISEGAFQPGDRLPSERELIEVLGMTRTSLRHALESLERSGAIWRHVGKGTFLASEGGEPHSDAFFELGKQLTPVKMIQARLCFEPAIAREAALNASADALENILREKERNADATDWGEYRASDDAFHRAIAAATDNILLVALFERLTQVKDAVTWGTVTDDRAQPQVLSDSFAEHSEICVQIQARNPTAAEQAMRRHIRSVSARIFGEI